MYGFLVALFSVFLTLSANAAGFGYNPFEKGSPTAPGSTQSPHPVNPTASPSAPKSAPAVAPQAKPDTSSASKPTQQPKK